MTDGLTRMHSPGKSRRRFTVATLGVAAATALATAGVIVSLSSELIDRASAGQAKFARVSAQTPPRDFTPDVPEPPPLRPLRLAIRATNISWVTACADGKKVLERLFHAGDAIDIPFSETAILRSGNAGGLEVALAGQSFIPMGPWGATRMLQATPLGYVYVTPILNDPCAVP